MVISLEYQIKFGVVNMTSKGSSSEKIRYVVLTGLFAALIYLFTSILKIPTGNGYTHAGDGIIFLAASILPMPYAMAAGAIGGALADGLTGFYIWMPATIIIKAITATFFTSKKETIINTRNIIALIPSLILCVVGYGLYEGTLMAGKLSWQAIAVAFAQTPFYCLQIAVSTVLYIVIGTSFDKLKLKSKIC